jgi:hypothetical protein
MEGQTEAHEVLPVAENSRCDVESCGEPAPADLEGHPLCLEHFVAVAMTELETRSERIKNQSFETSVVKEFQQFLADCETRANGLSKSLNPDDNRTKQRLLDVLRRISQSKRGLRRSPRFSTSLPVWLRREDPSRTWEEETWTSSVSRHGAGFSCHHSVDIGGEVVLCRRDRGSRVRARVVYSRFDVEGRRQIGVELVDQDDFWDLEKLSPGVASRVSAQ